MGLWEEVKFGLCLGPLSYLHDEGLDGASGFSFLVHWSCILCILSGEALV